MNRLSRILTVLLSLGIIQAAVMAKGSVRSAGQSAQSDAKQQEPAKPKQDAKEEDCGCDAKPPADVAAMVNGTKVTFKEVDEPIQAKIDELQKQVVQARHNELERQIGARLLQWEAKRRGIPIDKLETEILSRVKEPTEADAQEYYDKNKDQIQGEFNDVQESIIGYLRGQRQQEAMNSAADKIRPAAKVQVLIADPPVPKTEAERAKVLATVNGSPITSANIEDALRSGLFDAKTQIYLLRKQSLDARINTILLEAEARKRNVTPRELFESEIARTLQPVKESDARKFYEENKERIAGGYIQVRGQIIEYLEGQEQTRASSAFADKLRTNAKLQNYLTAPESPLFEISTDDQPWRGNVDAPVTVIEFTDFQCPSCGRTQPILDQVINEMGPKVRLVVRDFPLEMHQYAQKAAEAAEAARAQGKYWEYAAVLFQHQTELQVDKLKEYASQVGLDRTKFDKALDSGQYVDQVKRDLKEGTDLGVNSTPSIFVNGRKVQDKTAEGLKAAIEAAMKSATRDTSKKQDTSKKPIAAKKQ
jgi:protein-disulfide isomerase